MNVFFTDLDDTLFSSLRKHDAQQELRAEALLKNGDPVSFSCFRQRRLRALMAQGEALFIPVTARSVEAFGRAGVSGYHKAICANGAVLLNADGSPDQAWQRLLQRELHAIQQPLLAFERSLRDWAQQHDVRMWLVTEEGVGHIYCVLKSNRQVDGDGAAGPADALGEQAAQLRAAPPPWVGTVHHNGNNLAIIPRVVSKARAVASLWSALQGVHAECVSFGVGDSRSDWSFMNLCDFAVLPTRSQLALNIASQLPELDLC